MKITFHALDEEVAVYDYHEIRIRAYEPILDPFRTVCIKAAFDGKTIAGFCDSQDGSVFRVRLMPTREGVFPYAITFQHGETIAEHTGEFTAKNSGRKGMLRLDSEFPAHFMWEGTGEHFFWNGTTAYLLAGCSDSEIMKAIDRLYKLGINRLRVALCPSRQKDGGRWHESQVAPNEIFTYSYSPWIEARPDDFQNPGADVTRFNVSYWRKYERLLAHARRYDITVQVIFFVDAQEPQNYPFDRNQLGTDINERLYYDYASARLGAFSNVEWCITNEWALFRPDEWVDTVGASLSANDPYNHLTSVHGHGHFPFRASEWADFALFQSWDEHGAYHFMLKNRNEQAATGRVIPQINEEYGYEDHYPGPWGEGRIAPARAADSRRRLAWEITMAGAYQTTGESAANGLGGWVNGLGDDSMTMLHGYKHLITFFTSFAWWRLEPYPTLAQGALCLAEEGVRYALYLPNGAAHAPDIGVPNEGFTSRWYNPRAGQFADNPDTEGDWALLIEKE